MVKLMSPADAMFLMPESSVQYMHVGGLQVFGLPGDADDAWVPSMYGRMITSTQIDEIFRKRPHRSLATLGTWSWQVDPDLDLEHHVRHSALPRPCRVRELLALTSRLHATPLDRHRPLWETHVIEGLEGNRFAVYTKLHHSLMDGVSAMRLLERSLSHDPDERKMPPPWAPRSKKRSLSSSPAGGERGPLGAASRAARDTLQLAAVTPTLARLATKALTNQAAGLRTPAPHTIFNVGITGSRRYAAQTWPLDRIRALARAAGVTVNDVVLAMCSSALRRYLEDLNELPDLPLVAMTPVSLRSTTTAGEEAAGNSVGLILCNLATDLNDPVDRLNAIHDSMQWGKDVLSELSPVQIMALGAAAMAPLVIGVLAMGRMVWRPPFNLVISNVPGPEAPLYFDGALLQGMYPLSIPTHGQALNITVTSYNGGLHFGLTGCRRNVPHLQRLLGHLDTGLRELDDLLVP